MDKERFTHFRSEFVQFIQLIKKGNDIDAVLAAFLREYSELTAEFEDNQRGGNSLSDLPMQVINYV